MVDAAHADRARTPSSAWPGIALDASLYLDTALRWEIGLGFVRSRWLGAAFVFLLASWLLRSFLAHFRVVSFAQAILIFPLWCWAFYLASTGNPYFDWRSVPVADFFRVSLLDAWLYDGGLLTAAIAAASSAALAPGLRFSTPHGQPRPPADLLRGFGWALLILAGAAFLPVVSLPTLTVGRDPRDPLGNHTQWLQIARFTIWSAVAFAGALRLRRGRDLARAQSPQQRKPTSSR